MNGFCPNCLRDTTILPIKKEVELDIRGEKIPVEVEYFQCEECGEDFEIPRPDYDPLAIAYAEYRRRKNLVYPEELRKFRKKYGFTQKELSELFGIGIATLNRYENGALQDEAHDLIIRLGMQPDNLLELIERNPSALPADKKQKVVERLHQEEIDTGNLIDFLLDNLANYPQDIFSGYQKFDLEKFSQLITFFCFQERIFKTKLMKLLFYADFKHFKEYTVSLTGARYAHANHGPVPDQFEKLFALLLDRDDELEREETWCGEHPGETFTSHTQPNIALFSPSELKTIASIKEKFEHFNAKQIRDFSHREKGYIQTTSGQLISYDYAEALQI